MQLRQYVYNWGFDRYGMFLIYNGSHDRYAA